MPIGDVVSCEMCLQPDETDSMVYVGVESTRGELIRTAVFCRVCIGAILMAARSKLAEEGEQPQAGDAELEQMKAEGLSEDSVRALGRETKEKD
jgi:hypothetical protein